VPAAKVVPAAVRSWRLERFLKELVIVVTASVIL